jgi:hypothetical protein
MKNDMETLARIIDWSTKQRNKINIGETNDSKDSLDRGMKVGNSNGAFDAYSKIIIHCCEEINKDDTK